MKKTLMAMLALCMAVVLAACGGRVAAEEEPMPTEPPEATQTDDSMVPESSMLADQRPALPGRLQFVDGIPLLQVYVKADEEIREMELESYVMGVLAGEMRADWPMEALKAQAVLARTFVLKFLSEKESMYEGADISTDINEAQAYDAEAINSRIEKAVQETAGQVLVYNGEFPYTWFHAHSGGMTDYPTLALDFAEDDPDYIVPVESPDSDKAPTTVKSWKVGFSESEVTAAAKEAGADIDALSSIAIGQVSDTGRAVTLLVNGQEISAPRFRIALDSTRLKSAMLTSVSYENGRVVFEGKGYGHGVGMSQWGAYGMAENGSTYKEIIDHYFRGLHLLTLWP